MFLTDIFEVADRGKLDKAIKSFESHLHSLDVEGDKAADILQAVFSQVSSEFGLDADTEIALADWLKKEHNLSNLREGEVVSLRRSEDEKYDDAVTKQAEVNQQPMEAPGLGLKVIDEYLLPFIDAGKIPDEYNSIEDWLWDFWPELHWADPRQDIKEILNHPRYNEIVTFFREKYNFNFDKELKDAFYEYRGRDLELPMSETTSAGSVAGVNSALGAGDPKASIYYNQKKKKKYKSKYARMNQLAEQIATMEAQLIKNHAPSSQKLTEAEAEAVYVVKELIENLDYDPDDAMKEAEGLLIYEGHDTEGLDWCSVADHILILN